VLTSGSNATWTVPTGVTAIQVEMVGGGGSGGYAPTSSAAAGGAGGGAGGYIRATLNVSSGSNITYTVGTGGAAPSTATTGSAGTSTTISYGGNTATANGGAGPYYSSATNPVPGGVGGTVSIGTLAVNSSLQVTGGSGGTSVDGAGGGGGTGGSSYFGGGGSGCGVYSGAWYVAQAGQAYGSGGGGGGGGGTSYYPGAAGAPGVVIITYFTQSGLPTNYTATAPLSMTGTTLSIAAATSNAPGVVQVGSGLSVNSNGVLSVASTSEVPVLYALPSIGQGYVPYRFAKSSSAVNPTQLYFSYADTDQTTNNYSTFTCPSSISQQQNWHGFVGFYSATANQFVCITILIYTGTSGGGGSLVFQGSYYQYVTPVGTAMHLPIAFMTKLSSGNYSIYIGLLPNGSGVTLVHDTGHSQYLTFTPI